jgi:hypothetical protein
LRELSQFTGLSKASLVVFTPWRLMVHEVLVRVTADISIPDGPGSEDLGVHYRQMCDTLIERYIRPGFSDLQDTYEALAARISRNVSQVLTDLPEQLLPPLPLPITRQPWYKAIPFLKTSTDASLPRTAAVTLAEREEALIALYRNQRDHPDAMLRTVHRALVEVLISVRATHGRIVGGQDLLGQVVTGICCNRLGADELGGKSTQRPRQRELAARIGIDWSQFALISPDIFRKYLLDYASLGNAYKYAGMLTGEELRVVDQKLDRYMAKKARGGAMPHLLVDRFRFDSFAPESALQGSNLVTRFGSEIYLFFLVTPPHETVERAWERGLRVGRYKTVDDLLYHNIEAFSGMPDLFFTWALNDDKKVHYEFINNDVAYGDSPTTIACGQDGVLAILDLERLRNIDRYRHINITATSPDEVYLPDPASDSAGHDAFLRNCLKRLPQVDFADGQTARVYLRIEAGKLTGINRSVCPHKFDATTKVLRSVDVDVSGQIPQVDACVADLSRVTLGEWQ